MSAVPLIEVYGIVKTFGSLVANDIDAFEVKAGEIHALLGENGAGKSTLSKILYGYYRPDRGDILLEGKKVAISSPRVARGFGIGMVFQTFALIPAFSVFENIALFLTDLPFVLRREEIRSRITDFASRYGLKVDLDAMAGQLSAGEQQQVEILKQLFGGARILILDEPTKVLTPQESRGLFESMAALKENGYAVIFITHKLPEVLACADRITVMRQGRIAGRVNAAETDETQLLSLMFEKTAPFARQRAGPVERGAYAAPVVDIKSASTAASGGNVPLNNVSLQVRSGEIVGIAGIAGNGQRELSDLILGVTRPSRGMKRLWGEDAARWSIAKTRARGAASISDDPSSFSSVPALCVRENLALGSGKKYRSRFGLDWRRLESDMNEEFTRFRLPRPPFEARTGTLSGGNLQRLVLGRELARQPGLIVALYPTRGLDVQSANAVRDLLQDMRAKGAALLVVSEELEELFQLCDRIVVMGDGRLTAEFEPEGYDAETIGSWMVRTPERGYAA